MNERVIVQQSTAATLMTAWLASGGAVEALAATDMGAARAVRSRQHQSSGDDGLQAHRSTASYPFCADDGLQAHVPTFGGPCSSWEKETRGGASVDDGLQTIAVPSVLYSVS